MKCTFCGLDGAPVCGLPCMYKLCARRTDGEHRYDGHESCQDCGRLISASKYT